MEQNNPDFSYLNVTQQQPELKSIQEKIQQKSPIQPVSDSAELKNQKLEVNFGTSLDAVVDKRLQTYDNTTPFLDVYKSVGSGAVSMYDTYTPRIDNQEMNAQNQTTWDKWSNGLTKAGANLLTTVAGNTVGFVVGAAEGVSQGSWNAVFDNGFSNYLADINDKLNYQLPNYVSKDEQDDNFLESMGTANFWAKDVMGGLSFTLGTVVSEALWGVATGGILNSAKWGIEGAKLANKLRWGKVALGAEETAVGLANYKKLVADGTNLIWKNAALETKGAIIASKTAKVLNTARFLMTSSGNEAGIEALQYKREQTENFYRDFSKLNGREPSQEEIAKFNDNLETSANYIYATNFAILAPSNIAMFGSLFNINSPTKGIAKAMNKSLFGIGVEKTVGEAGEIAYKGLEATGKQKIAQYTYSALKPLISEGIWEEGLQGVTTKSAENWITSTYDPKYNNKTMALSDATAKAFADQYGTKAGWKEIGIGGIIGIGSSVVIGGGNFEEIHEFKKAQEYQDKYVAGGLNEFGDQSTLATDSIVKKMMFHARTQVEVEKQKSAIDKGDDVGAALSQNGQLLSEMQFRKSMGENLKRDLVAKYEVGINSVPNDSPEFVERGITDPQGYKDAVIKSYKELVNSYEKASNFADAVLGDSKILGADEDTQQLKDALTYSIVSGQKANVIMNSLLQDIGKVLGDESQKSLQIQTNLQMLGKEKIKQVQDVNRKIAITDREVKTLSRELQRLQVSKDETKGAKLQKVQEKLTEANEKSVELTNERNILAQNISQETKRYNVAQGSNFDNISLIGETITGNDLAGIDEKLQKIEDSIKSYKGVNHEVYYDLLDLKRQYNSAKENFFSYQSSVDAIINGQFQPKFAKMDGVLGRVFNSKKTINNFTKEYLTQINENYLTGIAKTTEKNLTEDMVSDEVYKTFKETGEVPEEILRKIAEKVRQKVSEKNLVGLLTEREEEIFKANPEAINALLKPSPNKPELSPRAIEDRELAQLENQKNDLGNKEELTEEETKQLKSINDRIVEINKGRGIETPAQELRQQIEQSFAKDYPMLTQDVDEMIKGKPTEAEVNRYQDLYKKQANFTDSEQKEFEELQPRMQRWFMAQSLPVGGATIADLVELLSQVETQTNKNETLDEIDSDTLAEETAEQKSASSSVRQDILQNIAGNAVVKIKDNDIYFMHLNPKTFFDRLVPTVSAFSIQKVNDKGKLTKAQDLTPALLASESKVTGTVFTIGNTRITIGEKGSVVMSLEDYNKVKDILNMYYFDSNSGKWSFADVYEKLDDGTTRKVNSEFETNTISDYIYDTEVGNSLNLFVDMKTNYNQDLIYQALQEIDENGKISEELKTKITNTLEITSREGIKNNSTLKAMYDSVSDDNFAYIRKKYADKFIETLETEQALATIPTKINLEAEISVKDIFLGTPNYQLDENLKPKELEITESGANVVITQGFVKGSEMTLGNKALDTENISRLYVTNLVKANPELKIPVVILQKGVHQFAFPITMVKTTENKESQLDAILTAVETPVEATKLINNLMISLGSSTRVVKLTNEEVDKVRTELQNYTTFRTADELADVKYDKKQLVQDATSKIDLDDALISSPKITIDYDTLTIGKLEDTENDIISLRKDIVKDLRAVEKIVNSSVEIPDKNRLIQTFDNNAVENAGTDIMNRKDINFIKKYFFNEKGGLNAVQGSAVDIIGKDRILKLRDKLQTLQFYENSVKAQKDKETERKLNCN